MIGNSEARNGLIGSLVEDRRQATSYINDGKMFVIVGGALVPMIIFVKSHRRSPGYKALRKGRVSMVNARYFITCCTLNRASLLWENGIPRLLFKQFQMLASKMELDALVVMPDHFHAVVRLVDGELADVLCILKSKSAREINSVLKRTGSVWQAGFFDRKFRGDEDLAPILSYMWKNPSPPGKNFRCQKEEWIWFKSMVTQDMEYPDWLRNHPMG